MNEHYVKILRNFRICQTLKKSFSALVPSYVSYQQRRALKITQKLKIKYDILTEKRLPKVGNKRRQFDLLEICPVLDEQTYHVRVTHHRGTVHRAPARPKTVQTSFKWWGKSFFKHGETLFFR